ncbi:M-phase inducer phosphatase 1-like [Varroa jacobsoni]|uniref:M-phase inducer phosphatase n=1 Tax=Varroa destructor TaxID=109461 RepID=A0A7M7JC14_VARDE|nr:M-phase inducer phosphatase 1-like [Varroa destructor]XP_022689546.1 M-phase inducer phosphatase 1-like [Varroa jacobsoni]
MMDDLACPPDNVSPVTDLSRNLTTLRTITVACTPQMPSKILNTETPDSAGSFRLKALTPVSECSSESEAEPSPLTVNLRRRALMGQTNKNNSQDSPLLINRNIRRPLKRPSQELKGKEEPQNLSSPLRKSSSQGYSSSTSDGFAVDEVNLDEDGKNKENVEPPSALTSLLSAPITSEGVLCKKASSSARRNLSFANGDSDTPVKSKRSNDDERSSKRSRTSRCLVEVSANIMEKLPKYYSESNIDREAAEGVIDKQVIETTLPTSGAHKSCALPTITAQTMNDIINGVYDHVINSFQIIDCRYPYEYDGGHIKGALNLYTPDHIIRQFLQKMPEDAEVERESKKKDIVIFHCEFSSERGPKMSQFLRELDRAANVYPKLFYPEVYILQGGYKEFFCEFKEHCQPQEYLKMVDERFVKQLRLYRTESKTFEKKGLTRNQSSRF